MDLFLRDGFMPFTFTVTSTSTFTMLAGDTLTPAVRWFNRRGTRRSNMSRPAVHVLVNVNMYVNEWYMRSP
jgi:hypothetical protein